MLHLWSQGKCKSLIMNIQRTVTEAMISPTISTSMQDLIAITACKYFQLASFLVVEAHQEQEQFLHPENIITNGMITSLLLCQLGKMNL